MKRETILAINGGSITTESGVKTAIGDAPHEVGDIVWVDGSCVFGSRRPATPPVMFGGGVGINFSCFIVMVSDYITNATLYILDCKTLAEKARFVIRLKTIIENCKSFCYSRDYRKFAWICADNYSVIIYEIIDGILNKKNITVCSGNNSEGVEDVIGWYDGKDVLNWRVYIQNESSYSRAYPYEKTKYRTEINASYMDDLVSYFSEYKDEVLQEKDNRAANIKSYMKSADSGFLVKHNSISMIFMSSETDGTIPNLNDYKLVATKTYPLELVKEGSIQAVTNRYDDVFIEDMDHDFPDDAAYQFGIMDNNNNYTETGWTGGIFGTVPIVTIGGPAVDSTYHLQSIRAKTINLNISTTPIPTNNYASNQIHEIGTRYWTLLLNGIAWDSVLRRTNDAIGVLSGNSSVASEHFVFGFYNKNNEEQYSTTAVARFSFKAKAVNAFNGNVETENIFDAENTVVGQTKSYPIVYEKPLNSTTPRQVNDHAWWYPDKSCVKALVKSESYQNINNSSSYINIQTYNNYDFSIPNSSSFSKIYTLIEQYDDGFTLETQSGEKIVKNKNFTHKLITNDEITCINSDSGGNALLTCYSYVNSTCYVMKINATSGEETYKDIDSEQQYYGVINTSSPFLQGVTADYIKFLFSKAFENFTN